MIQEFLPYLPCFFALLTDGRGIRLRMLFCRKFPCD
jgi:hypothetical protein